MKNTVLKKILFVTTACIVSSSFIDNALAGQSPATQTAQPAAVSSEKASDVKAKDDASKAKESEPKKDEGKTEAEPSADEQTQAPTLKINGFTLFSGTFGNQTRRENGKGGTPVHFATAVSDLYFTIAGKAEGYEYKYRVNFQAFPDSGPTVDQNYIEIKTKYYGFRLGNTVGPEDFAIKDASSVIGGSGGFETTAFTDVYNLPAGIIKGNDNICDTGKSLKIVFISPEYNGLQFSVAYTPNVARVGDNGKDNNTLEEGRMPSMLKGLYVNKALFPMAHNNWAFGLNYNYASGPWGLQLSGAVITEKATYTVVGGPAQSITKYKLHDSWAYQLGAIVSYEKWKFGAGYLNNGKARLPKIANMPLKFNGNGTTQIHSGDMHRGTSGQAYNVGIGYTFGSYEVSAAYQHFTRKTDAINKVHNNVWTIGGNVNVFKGWQFFGEVDVLKSKTNKSMLSFANNVLYTLGKTQTAIDNNNGVIGIVGTKISF